MLSYTRCFRRSLITNTLYLNYVGKGGAFHCLLYLYSLWIFLGIFDTLFYTLFFFVAARHLHQHQSISPHPAAALQAERLPDQLPKRRRHVPQLRPQLPNARPWTHQPLQAVSTSGKGHINPCNVIEDSKLLSLNLIQ